MPKARTDDGVQLHYEEAGSGTPILFIHEFAGDHRSWEPQLRYFSRRYRCIAYSARGYPPSDVPQEQDRYSQERAHADARDILRHLDIDAAFIVGLSMGGFCALHFGLNYPQSTLGMVVAGCGYGAEKDSRAQFQAEAEAAAEMILTASPESFATTYGSGPTRVQYIRKDPRGWEEFRDQLAEHDRRGSANTLLGVQRLRPSIFDLEEQLAAVTVPTLILTGDEDDPCLQPGLFLKRKIRSSALEVMPNAGHTINLEDPDRFNASLDRFFAEVQSGRWPVREDGAGSGAILGLPDQDA